MADAEGQSAGASPHGSPTRTSGSPLAARGTAAAPAAHTKAEDASGDEIARLRREVEEARSWRERARRADAEKDEQFNRLRAQLDELQKAAGAGGDAAHESFAAAVRADVEQLPVLEQALEESRAKYAQLEAKMRAQVIDFDTRLADLKDTIRDQSARLAEAEQAAKTKPATKKKASGTAKPEAKAKSKTVAKTVAKTAGKSKAQPKAKEDDKKND